MKAQDHIEETVNSPVTDSPKDVRKGTAAYWKIKYQNLKEATSPNEIDLKDVPGLLKIKHWSQNKIQKNQHELLKVMDHYMEAK